MFSGLYFDSLFKKFADSLHDSLNPLAESPAGLGHGVHGEVCHHLHDLHHQGGGSVVGGFVYFLFSNAPNVVVRGLQSGLLGGQTSFGQNSGRFSLHHSWVVLLLWVGAPSY
jgi:hypothetical protein